MSHLERAALDNGPAPPTAAAVAAAPAKEFVSNQEEDAHHARAGRKEEEPDGDGGTGASLTGAAPPDPATWEGVRTWNGAPSVCFEDMPRLESPAHWVLRGVFAYGFETPKPLQQLAIPALLSGQDTILPCHGKRVGVTSAIAIAAMRHTAVARWPASTSASAATVPASATSPLSSGDSVSVSPEGASSAGTGAGEGAGAGSIAAAAITPAPESDAATATVAARLPSPDSGTSNTLRAPTPGHPVEVVWLGLERTHLRSAQHMFDALADFVEPKPVSSTAGRSEDGQVSLAATPAVVFSSPARMRVMLDNKRLSLSASHMRLLVLENLDAMLTAGYRDLLHDLITRDLPRSVQMVVTTASPPHVWVKRFVASHMKDPWLVPGPVDCNAVPRHLTMDLTGAPAVHDAKWAALTHILEVIMPTGRQCIVYCGSRRKAEWVSAELGDKWRSGTLHLGFDAAEREPRAHRFLLGETRVLVVAGELWQIVPRVVLCSTPHVRRPTLVFFDVPATVSAYRGCRRVCLAHSLGAHQAADFEDRTSSAVAVDVLLVADERDSKLLELCTSSFGVAFKPLLREVDLLGGPALSAPVVETSVAQAGLASN